MLRLRLRLAFNALVALVPRWMLTGFFKTFLTRPEVAEAAGFHVHPRRFDSPLPLMEEINWEQVRNRRDLPGIDLRVPSALELVAKLRPFAAELDSIPYQRDDHSPFWFSREFIGSFPEFDAAILYSLLRYLKPERYIELGCGFSSHVSSHALRRNDREGVACEAIYADPAPRLPLSDVLIYGRLIQKRVQDLPMELFSQLQTADVLFIDTSHVLKIQSDVTRLLVQILPTLKPGVWIHFHDVFTPYDYPEDWLKKPVRLSSNEQFAVECLLSGGDRYEVLLPLYLLWKEQRESLQKFFPRGTVRPHSFWILKR